MNSHNAISQRGYKLVTAMRSRGNGSCQRLSARAAHGLQRERFFQSSGRICPVIQLRVEVSDGDPGFHVIEQRRILARKKCRRLQLWEFLVEFPSVNGVVACNGAVRKGPL